MKQSRLDALKKEHPGITVVNNLSEIWEKYKNDKRIYFEKNKRHSIEKIKAYDKGWLGNLRGNILSNALDGIYHIDFRKFINDSRNILPPFVVQWHFEKELIKEYKKHPIFEIPKNMNKGWPKDSGRPFIFVNHIKALQVEKDEHTQTWKFKKKIYSIDEIKKKMNNMKISRIQMPGTSGIFPSYWFPEPKNPFKRMDKNNHIKLKYLIEHGEEKYNEELVNMNKAMKIKGKPIPVKKPIVKESPDKLPVYKGYAVKDDDDDSEMKADSPPSSEISNDDSEVIRREELDRNDSISSNESLNSGEQALLHGLEETAHEQGEDVSEIAGRADKLEERMKDNITKDEYIDPKLKFITKLVKEKKSKNEIIAAIKDIEEWETTNELTIDAMISTAKRNLGLDGEDDSAINEETQEEQPETSKSPDQKLRDMGLERVKVKDDGDCLFETFHHILGNRVPKIDAKEERILFKNGPIMAIREDIVNWIATPMSLRDRMIPGPRENPEPTKNNVDFWHQYGERIMEERNEEDADKPMYKDVDAYRKCMTSIEPNPLNPRCQFGGIFEILAFEEMNNKEIQVIEWDGSNWIVPRDIVSTFGRDKKIDITKPTIIFDREKLHYDYARPIKTTQSGGGNNVYINKCKNHRHKRTRKFRIRLKNVGDWVHVKKPKKRTRRIY